MKFGCAIRLGGLLLLVGCGLIDLPVSDAQAQPGDEAPADAEGVMQVDKHAENEIILTRTFAVDRETLFAALTQADHLIHWMQPSNMALVACEVDLRAGGSFRYVFQRAGGPELEVRGTYQTVDAPNLFVYKETYDFSPLEVLVATALETAGETTIFKQTLVYPSEQQRDEDFDGVAASAREAYARLERYLK